MITTPEALFNALRLDNDQLPAAIAASKAFPTRCTHAFASRMTLGDINDPLLRQILPLGTELTHHPNFSQDPLNETQHTPTPGLIHKYKSRVLLMGATQCAVNCRYCFRREYPYQDNRLSKLQWQQALAYINKHKQVNEVILSGGDPLTASDNHLGWQAEQIAQIPHIQRLRIHSRLPVVLPNRITPQCITALTQTRLKTVIVIHCNHAQELDLHVQHALDALRRANVTLLNQTVLLQGINDTCNALTQLSEALFSIGVLPYYLHALDRVTGTQHFEVPLTKAKALYANLLAELPGYLVPKLVQEIPGRPSKTPVPP